MYCSTYYTTSLCIVFKDYYIKQQPTKSGLMLCGVYVVRVRVFTDFQHPMQTTAFYCDINSIATS